jgi:hypothetical protein
VNRITRASATSAALAIVAAAILAGCGGGGGDSTSASEAEKAADVQLLDYALAHELTTVDAFTRALPQLSGPNRDAARHFRAQAQEHVDAIVKAVRGLGDTTSAPTTPPCGETRRHPERTPKRCTTVEPTPFDAPPPRTRAEALAFLYGIENSTIRNHITEIGRLTTTWPRVLLTSIVADEAQQQVLLRRAMGAAPLDAVPEAFEIGDTPPPGSTASGTPRGTR